MKNKLKKLNEWSKVNGDKLLSFMWLVIMLAAFGSAIGYHHSGEDHKATFEMVVATFALVNLRHFENKTK